MDTHESTTTIALDRRPVLQSALVFRVLDDLSSVVLNSVGGEAHALNAVGTAIVERCDGSMTIDELIAEIADLFDTDDLQGIGRDVRAFLIDLQQRGLITW